MTRIGLVILACLIATAALAADWRGGPSSSDGVVSNYTLDPKGTRAAFFVFESADGTTTTGPTLRTVGCDVLDVTAFWDGATAGVKLYEGKANPGVLSAVTNLPQISADFDADGVTNTDALAATSIEDSGLREFRAYALVPIITSACSTGTCALKVQCGGSSK